MKILELQNKLKQKINDQKQIDLDIQTIKQEIEHEENAEFLKNLSDNKIPEPTAKREGYYYEWRHPDFPYSAIFYRPIGTGKTKWVKEYRNFKHHIQYTETTVKEINDLINFKFSDYPCPFCNSIDKTKKQNVNNETTYEQCNNCNTLIFEGVTLDQYIENYNNVNTTIQIIKQELKDRYTDVNENILEDCYVTGRRGLPK